MIYQSLTTLSVNLTLDQCLKPFLITANDVIKNYQKFMQDRMYITGPDKIYAHFERFFKQT